MKHRLCDEDRKLFGGPEWLEWSLAAISIADLSELADRFDFDPTDWPTPFAGELTLAQAGDPNAKPKPPRWQKQAMVWMMLRQNGVEVAWDETARARPFLAQTFVEPDENEDDETKDDESRGKGPATPPPSVPSTTRRSRTSSGSRRKTSTA